MLKIFRVLFPWWRHNRAPMHTISEVFSPYTSPVQRFKVVRGRRIAQDIPYLIPKDPEDANRLNFQHYMLRVALKGLYFPKIVPNDLHTILDVATGTGLWAIEMAHVFPRASVTGFDHIPPPVDDASDQTSYNPGFRPTNYVFQQGNMFDGLPFPDSSFDFVHMRLVYAAVPIDLWQPLVTELVRVTTPGGYIELVEGYLPIDTGPATATIIQAVIGMSKRRNIDLTIGKDIGAMLKHAGLHEVKQRTVFIPIGAKHGRLGNLCEKDMLSVYKGIGTNVIDTGVMPAEMWNSLFAQMPQEFQQTDTLWPVFQAVGKKSSRSKQV